jgi:hypothetical protein
MRGEQEKGFVNVTFVKKINDLRVLLTELIGYWIHCVNEL